MLKNYFRIVIQNLIRHKTFTLINILGLAIGIACSVIVVIWVNHEFSFDRYYDNIDRIGQIFSKDNETKEIDNIQTFPLATAAKKEVPEVEAITPYLKWNSKNYIAYKETKYCFTFDYTLNDFFKIFSFNFIEGNPNSALLHDNSIVITQRVAQLIFGNESAIGKKILYNNQILDISAVIKNNPTNSQFQFDILSNIHFLKHTGWDVSENKWNDHSYYIYLLKKENVKNEVLDKKLNDVILKNSDANYKVFYYPFSDIYLKSPIGIPLISRLKMFVIAGLLLILIACINYINLSTARYSQRIKEIGIRKVFGAKRSQIAQQHLGESFLYALVSTYIGILLADILLPVFNYLAGTALVFPWSDQIFWSEILAVIVLTTLFTGIYPAYLLSKFQPVNALRNITGKGISGSLLRNILVLIQFTCTIFFIICALVTAKQNSYISNKDLGFTKDNILYTFISDTLIVKNYNAIKDELLSNPVIEDVTRSRDVPFEYGSWTNDVAQSDVDYNFFNFFNMRLVSGGAFNKTRIYNSNDVVVNETLAEMLANKSTDVGWLLERNLNIIGVVKDYHIQSLRNPMKPLLIRNNIDDRFQMFVKHLPNKELEAQKLFNDLLKKYSVESNNEIFFLKEMIKKTYENEKQQLYIYLIYSVITILISCLGLIGLTIYSVERRVKEIGIRKASGAHSFSIIILFIRNISKWILIAFILALVPAYFFMQSWLNNFSYKTEITWWIFALAGLIAYIISLFTVVWLTWRAANRNPVDALRYE